MVSDPTLQLTLKKVTLIEFWCYIKEKYPQLYRKLLKYSSLFQLRILWFNVKANRKILLCSVKSSINEIWKYIIKPHSSPYCFCAENIKSFFIKIYVYMYYI